ncbi:MAG: pyridoxal-phosphate dependent enzyme [Desulfotomaculaceae bacterium]|nr:pyridoxal-phosphate dependent enzyme [Desulfotomaculaceae bacterium]
MSRSKIPFGPTYEEMLHPRTIAPEVRGKALKAANKDEMDPINLFNITWKDVEGRVRKIVLPKELTGVDANIVVLLGTYLPSGSHKVGPAYTILTEGCVKGEIVPGEHTILSFSTGNFGIGVSYICRLLGCRAVVLMPDNMSQERYQQIRKYGAKIELTSSTASGVILAPERILELKQDPRNKFLDQFGLMANYRFHRHVTGNSAVEAVRSVGNGRIACFVSAPGSGGTIAAGDQVKSVFPEAKVAALEPYECSTLANGNTGQHQIAGIGDQVCSLIHNVLTTDFVALVKDDDCVRGLKLLYDGARSLCKAGVSSEMAEMLKNLFGVSGICNILGAIKMARYLRLGPGDNVVTVATDGIDRYYSVLDDLSKRTPGINDTVLESWYRSIFIEADSKDIYDFRMPNDKERLFKQKEKDWLPYGHSQEYLDAMRNMGFWEEEYLLYKKYDQEITHLRK